MTRVHVTITALLLVACEGSQPGDATPDAPPAIACTAKPVQLPSATTFTNISAASGIQAGNFVVSPPTAIPINDHSRLGFVDLNGDGCDDIVAHDLFPNPKAGIPYTHLVFESRCDGTFADVSESSGLRHVQAGFFAFADVDNDGDQDCFAGLDIPLAGLTSSLWLNDGTGKFTRKPASGVEGAANATVAGNAVFADFDGDARLDLFIGNGQTSYAALDDLFLGRGDGTFTKATTRLAGNPSSPSNGSVACDYDDDGDLDILVAVYGVSQGGAQNVLYQNDGHGAFTNVAIATGFASLPTGNYWIGATGMGRTPEPNRMPGTYVGSNAFGLACEDADRDGDLDVVISSISHPGGDYNRTWSDPTVLLLNSGAVGGYKFTNAWLDRGLPYNEGDVDAAMIDFDNDGRIDISLSRTDKYEAGYTTELQKGWFGLMHQGADGMFAALDRSVGLTDEDGGPGMKGAQNHAWSDIDRDGDLDLLIGARDQGGGRANLLFRNDLGDDHHWLALRMRGDGTAINRDAIGTRVTITAGDTRLVREVKASRGTYNSMDTPTLYFGLGDLGCAFDVEVRWPDGTLERFSHADTDIDRIATIRYGAGIQ
ncbi:MAG: CRTAC1 family protein [Deltaproteobacteria bacterium]|nr:CRTAC1 family protein [Deltaproteobacteria bacterium]